MVIAVLLQRISYLFSTCWYFKYNRILSHCLNALHFCPAPDHIQDKVDHVNTSKPAGGENPPTKEPKQVKTGYNERAHTNRRKGKPKASRQGDQKDHNTESHRIPTTEVNPTKIASKEKHQEAQKQTKRVS